MTERLLQFIWQFQYFNNSELASTSGEPVYVLFPGLHNTNQGPDFSDGKIRIGEATWAGTVELHIRTSDWKKHHHDEDSKYKNVILHVVWEDDSSRNSVPVDDERNRVPFSVPILELKSRVSKLLLRRYEELMISSAFIPCEKLIHNVPEITWKSWKDRLLAERLLRKAKTAETLLQQSKIHWEEAFWWLLARNFGMKVNADAFEAMARSIPLTILSKHKNQIHQLEALLLGQAGLLDDEMNDDYPRMLQKEYRFLRNKYKLGRVHIQPLFLRMRPGNFPTLRLAQLAMLVHQSAHLFNKVKEADSIKEVIKLFDITANDYWHYHYRFDAGSSFSEKKLGRSMISNIIINTIAPVLFAYGNYQQDQKTMDKALRWLDETDSESNAITKGFEQLGIENKKAYDSQALIELKNEYCDKKRCLDCSVGNFLLKRIHNRGDAEAQS